MVVRRANRLISRAMKESRRDSSRASGSDAESATARVLKISETEQTLQYSRTVNAFSTLTFRSPLNGIIAIFIASLVVALMRQMARRDARNWKRERERSSVSRNAPRMQLDREISFTRSVTRDAEY